MSVTIHVNGTSCCLVHKASTGIAKCTMPDVCKTPSPAGPVPIPYPVIISVSSDLAKGTKTVKVDGGNMAAIKGSEFSRCTGDEPGTAGGVVSQVNMKEATWILFSFDVKLDGQNACRLSDKMLMNHMNTACLAGETDTPVEGEDPTLRDPKEDSMARDKQRGWDHENKTKDGKSVEWALMDTPPKNKELIYVKKPDGTFVFSPRPKEDLNQRGGTTLPHTMLGEGKKVVGAGECKTDDDGKIEQADNFSGHYQPKEENMKKTKENMEKQELSSDDAKFEVKDKTGKVVKTL